MLKASKEKGCERIRMDKRSKESYLLVLYHNTGEFSKFDFGQVEIIDEAHC